MKKIIFGGGWIVMVKVLYDHDAASISIDDLGPYLEFAKLETLS